MSGIANSGKKVVSSGGNVVSGIKSGAEKIANSGGKALSGIASSGGKAIHTITSPVGNAVRMTVDSATDSLHGHKSHSTSSAKVPVASEVSDGSKQDSASAPASAGGTAPEKVVTGGSDDAISESSHSSRGLLGNVEHAANKLLINPVKGAVEKVAESGNKLLVTPVKGATNKTRTALHFNKKQDISNDVDVEEEAQELPEVPPDDTLKKMNVIISKRLKDVSIQDYYAIAWSEGDRTNKAPLYGPWLKESGKQQINVGEWEFADDGVDFVGNWDGEKYSQRRIVTFVFNKQIPFQMGPTLAKVKHTQYCRVEGKDKCVLAMTIDMQGVPYSDCFTVEIRWVASRSGKNDIAIQVGLFVNFVKSTIMASKIRSGTTEQTTQQQVQLFRTIKNACGTVSEEVVVKKSKSTKDADTGGQLNCSWIANVFPFMHKDALADRDDEIAVCAKSANKKMKEVMMALSDSDPADTDPVVLDQLVVVNDALDKILST